MLKIKDRLKLNGIKDGYKRTEKTPGGFNDWLKTNGYSNRLSNSDIIDAKVRKSNADNVGLDTQASQGESFGELSDSNSKDNSRRNRLIKTGADGTAFPRAVVLIA